MTGPVSGAVVSSGPSAGPAAVRESPDDDTAREHDGGLFSDVLAALLVHGQRAGDPAASGTCSGNGGPPADSAAWQDAELMGLFSPTVEVPRSAYGAISPLVTAGSARSGAAQSADGGGPTEVGSQHTRPLELQEGETVRGFSVEGKISQAPATVRTAGGSSTPAQDPADARRSGIAPADLHAIETYGAESEQIRFDVASIEGERLVSSVVETAAEIRNTMPGSRLEVVVIEQQVGRILLRLFETSAGASLVIRAAAPQTYELLKSHFSDIKNGVARYGVTLEKITGGGMAAKRTRAGRNLSGRNDSPHEWSRQ